MNPAEFCRSVRDSSPFQTFIIGVIVLAGIVIGMETYPSMMEQYGGVLHFLDKTILWIFATEVVIKMVAEGKRPWKYFYDGWNVFDFTIVLICFLPVHAEYIAVLRLARILRVLRLVTALPKLQLLVGALLRSMPSMAYVGLLLFILFYVYAVTGTMLFGKNDPIHFGDLQLSMLSLFRVVTLEDWTDLMYIQMYGALGYGYEGQEHLVLQNHAQPIVSVVFFVSFVLIGTMVMLNLFIGVIMNGMQEAQDEAEAALERRHIKAEGQITTSDELRRLEHDLEDLQTKLRQIRLREAASDGEDASSGI